MNDHSRWRARDGSSTRHSVALERGRLRIARNSASASPARISQPLLPGSNEIESRARVVGGNRRQARRKAFGHHQSPSRRGATARQHMRRLVDARQFIPILEADPLDPVASPPAGRRTRGARPPSPMIFSRHAGSAANLQNARASRSTPLRWDQRSREQQREVIVRSMLGSDRGNATRLE